MSRKINLTESDLTNLVRKTIDEAVTGGGFGCCNGSMHCAHGCCGCKGQGLMGGHCCDSNEDPNGELQVGQIKVREKTIRRRTIKKSLKLGNRNSKKI